MSLVDVERLREIAELEFADIIKYWMKIGIYHINCIFFFGHRHCVRSGITLQ